MGKVAKGDIIPYYAEYLDESQYAATGFCLQGDCFIYDGDGRGNPHATGLLRKVGKSQENNIYVYRPPAERPACRGLDREAEDVLIADLLRERTRSRMHYICDINGVRRGEYRPRILDNRKRGSGSRSSRP